jgi:Ser/Thr protein kinase RdoA (MazF antagonist)
MTGQEEVFAGHVNTVRKVGDRLFRPTGPWSPAVHAVLRHLEAEGADGAPRVLAAHEREEVLSWIPGAVITAGEYDREALTALGRMLRRLHDATSTFALPAGVTWHIPAETGVPGAHVVLHGDLSPRNTIVRQGTPVAVIDWDLAQPGPRVWDIAHAVWQFLPIRAGQPVDTARMLAMLDGYAMPEIVPDAFADLVALRMHRTETGIAALAAAGERAFVRLRDEGVIAAIASDRTSWVSQGEMVDAAIAAWRSGVIR